MGTDEMPRCERTHERQLAGHDSSRNDACKLLRDLSGVRRVCARNAEHLEDGLLRSEDRASTNGASRGTEQAGDKPSS